MIKRASCFALLCFCVGSVSAQSGFIGRPLQTPDFEDAFEKKNWQEVAVHLPPVPKAGRLLPFFVSATARNSFFIDPDSLSIGSDGVVRYTLVVRAPEGGENVSFEGMRCQTRERRLYAFGRSDASWSKSRNSQWEEVRDGGVNRQHAALFQDFFCPSGILADSVESILRGLRVPQEQLIQKIQQGR